MIKASLSTAPDIVSVTSADAVVTVFEEIVVDTPNAVFAAAYNKFTTEIISLIAVTVPVVTIAPLVIPSLIVNRRPARLFKALASK